MEAEFRFYRIFTYGIFFFSCFIFNHLKCKTRSQLVGCIETGRCPDLSLGPWLADKKL